MQWQIRKKLFAFSVFVFKSLHFSSLHRRNATAVRHRCAQRCDSRRTRAQRCGSENEYRVVTAVAVTVQKRWQLTELPLLSQKCVHRCYTNVNIAVSALSVVTNVTLVCTVVAPLSVYIADTLMLLSSLSQCYLGHCCHIKVTYIVVTKLSLPLRLH